MIHTCHLIAQGPPQTHSSQGMYFFEKLYAQAPLLGHQDKRLGRVLWQSRIAGVTIVCLILLLWPLPLMCKYTCQPGQCSQSAKQVLSCFRADLQSRLHKRGSWFSSRAYTLFLLPLFLRLLARNDEGQC